MLKNLERTLIEQKCAVRMCAPPQGVSKFIVVAIAGNGIPLATGLGKTLEEAIHDMLVDLGVLEEELCLMT